jgi:perosamine synthetase
MILINEPVLNGNEKKYLMECVDTTFVSGEGPFVKKFEAECAKYFGVKHSMALNSGTAALEATIFALELKPGDEVILPSFTIISCVIALARFGVNPVLVDCNEDDWNMDVSQVEAKITDKTKAIMAVDMYGSPVDYDVLLELKEKYNLFLIEDFAESQGASYFSKKQNKWLNCGAIGDLGATSFYANKTITTGEGGLVTTNDDKLADRVRSYKNLCFIKGDRFNHFELGHNYRLSNLGGALGLAQLEQIDSFLEIKRKNGAYYKSKFDEVDGIKFHPVREYSDTIFWMYCIELDPSLGKTAKDVMPLIIEKGMEVRPFFKGLHDQPVMEKMDYFKGESYPNSDKAYKYGFYIPSGIGLSKEQMDFVFNTVCEIVLG